MIKTAFSLPKMAGFYQPPCLEQGPGNFEGDKTDFPWE